MKGRITQVDHLGIYVTDIDAAVRFWRDVVGLECTGPEDNPEHGIRLAHVCVNGLELELIEAPVEKTQLRHMPYQGPGIYHVGLRTDDVPAAMSRLQEAGLRALDPEPREGEGMRVQFASPDGPSQGVMIEVVERLRPPPADRKS
ncbi:MAG: VOC family protein [Candidatus Binatia bacterium]|nr:VOC family protein [Candidatus Binatia bacterium]